MEINNENVIVKVNTTNAERVRKWKLNHREKYLYDKKKLNTWNKYKKVYLNILLE
jgi:hypothetical protein